MPTPSPIELRYLVDVSQDPEGLEHAISSVAELSFRHEAYFSIFGDTEQIARCFSNYPYEAEFVETVHCHSPKEARVQIVQMLRTRPGTALATSQLSSTVSKHLVEAGCLLPHVHVPALTAIVPVVKDEEHSERDRYCTLLDIEGYAWKKTNGSAVLTALAKPIAQWFTEKNELRVGVLTAGGGAPISAAQRRLLDGLTAHSSPFTGAGALSPAQMMLGAADIALNVGEGGTMFVRTLEATFVAAEALVQRETQGVRGRLGFRIFRDRLEKLRDYGNIESYGGSLLLGAQAPCVVLRPDAGTRAWMNALRILKKMHETDVIGEQRDALQRLSENAL